MPYDIDAMVRTHPGAQNVSQVLIDCLKACHACETACITCADACLSEKDVSALVRCIRLNQDCAAVCGALGDVIARPGLTDRNLQDTLLRACIAACAACAAECERHAPHMEHCRHCADACRECEEACNRMLTSA